MITFSTLTMRIYTLLYKGPIRPTEVHTPPGGGAAWFYHLGQPCAICLWHTTKPQRSNEATWGDCGSNHKTRRHNHQKGWSHYCVRIDIAEGIPDTYQQEYNKPDYIARRPAFSIKTSSVLPMVANPKYFYKKTLLTFLKTHIKIALQSSP